MNYYTTQTYHAKKTGFTEGKDFVPRTDALLTYVTSKADITFDSDYYNAELSRWTDDHARDNWNIETRIVIPGRRAWLVRWVSSTPMKGFLSRGLMVLATLCLFGTCWITWVRSRLGSQTVVFQKHLS